MTTPTSVWAAFDDPAPALPDDKGAAGAARRIEQASRLDAAADSVQPLTRRLASGPAGRLLRGEWLGHAVHPMLTDLPIGFWTSSFVLDLVGGHSSRKASARLLGLGLASAIPAAASGAAEWSDVRDDRPRRVGVAHAGANTAALALYFCSWRARHKGHHGRGVLLGFGGAAAASVAGYLGGHLSFVHGIGQGDRLPQ